MPIETREPFHQGFRFKRRRCPNGIYQRVELQVKSQAEAYSYNTFTYPTGAGDTPNSRLPSASRPVNNSRGGRCSQELKLARAIYGRAKRVYAPGNLPVSGEKFSASLGRTAADGIDNVTCIILSIGSGVKQRCKQSIAGGGGGGGGRD